MALFTSVVCPTCDGKRDDSMDRAIVDYFMHAVDLFYRKHGGRPKEARIPPSWRPVLGAWQPPDARYAYIGLVDGEEDRLRLSAHLAGVLAMEDHKW